MRTFNSFSILLVVCFPAAAQDQSALLRQHECDCTREEHGLLGPVQSVLEQSERTTPTQVIYSSANRATYSQDGFLLERQYFRDGELRQRIAYSHESGPRRVVKESSGSSSASNYREVEQYDEAGRILFVDQRQQDGGFNRAEWHYSSDGLLETQSFASGASGSYRQTEYAYDDLGRLIAKIESCDSATCALESHRYEYPAPNTLRTLEFLDCRFEDAESDMPSIVNEKVFDAGGRVIVETISMTSAFDGASRRCGGMSASRTEMVYDPEGRLTLSRRFELDGRLTSETRYQYDSSGRQTQIERRGYREGQAEPSVTVTRYRHEAKSDEYGNIVSGSEEVMNNDNEISRHDTILREIVYY